MDINVAENLKQVREEHNLTQEALAECLGIEPLTVYRWEAGRLPVDFKVLVVIAEFYGVPVERFTRDSSDKKKKTASDQVSSNCKMCGGELVFNYLTNACECANCGKKWAITELYPKYAGITATITKANEILSTGTVLASADEAKLLFKQAINECAKYNDTLSSELVKICKDGQIKAKQLEIYCRGKHFFDNRAYKSALVELDKVSGFRDADEMIKRCRRQK